MKIIFNYLQQFKKDDKYVSFMLYNKPFTLTQNIEVLLDHPQILLICDACQRKLNEAVSILLVLSDKDRRDLCFSCFAKMDNLQAHKDACYYVRPNLNITFTEDKWNIMSQLKMLNAMKRHGYGNWGNIKHYLDYHASNFTEKEIEQHYTTFYLTHSLEPVFNDNAVEALPANKFTLPQNQYIEDVSRQNQHENGENQQNKEAMQGYDEKRQEHLVVYDPEAEDQIADLEFLDDDTPDETQLKYQLLEAYNQRLKERKKREKFVAQHRLLTKEYTLKVLGGSKLKGQIRREMSKFARFLGYDESQDIISSLTLQQSLQNSARYLMYQRHKFDDPSFQKAYQAMTELREKRNQTLYRTVPQLKIHQLDNMSGKRSLQNCTRLNEEEVIDVIKKKTNIIIKGPVKITQL